MPPDEYAGSDERPGVRDRLWRVEQRQIDIFVRLDKLDARIDGINQRQVQRRWSMEEIERKIEEIERGMQHNGSKRNGSRFGDSELIRAVVYGLLALVAALAAGQVINFGGFGG